MMTPDEIDKRDAELAEMPYSTRTDLTEEELEAFLDIIFAPGTERTPLAIERMEAAERRVREFEEGRASK